jgi:hypothetical protein
MEMIEKNLEKAYSSRIKAAKLLSLFSKQSFQGFPKGVKSAVGFLLYI